MSAHAAAEAREPILLNDKTSSRFFLKKGFGAVEDWGTWTEGNHAQVSFRLSHVETHADVWVELVYMAYHGSGPVSDFAIKPRHGEVRHVASVHQPGQTDVRTGFLCRAPEGVMDFEIFIPNPKQHHQEPKHDLRAIGVGLKSIIPTIL